MPCLTVPCRCRARAVPCRAGHLKKIKCDRPRRANYRPQIRPSGHAMMEKMVYQVIRVKLDPNHRVSRMMATVTVTCTAQVSLTTVNQDHLEWVRACSRLPDPARGIYHSNCRDASSVAGTASPKRSRRRDAGKWTDSSAAVRHRTHLTSSHPTRLARWCGPVGLMRSTGQVRRWPPLISPCLVLP